MVWKKSWCLFYFSWCLSHVVQVLRFGLSDRWVSIFISSYIFNPWMSSVVGLLQGNINRKTNLPTQHRSFLRQFPQSKPDLGFFPNLEPNLAKPRPFTVDSGPKSERWKRRDPSPSRLCRLCRPRQLPRCRGRSPSFPARCCQRKAGSGELETSAIRHGWALETHCRMMWECVGMGVSSIA